MNFNRTRYRISLKKNLHRSELQQANVRQKSYTIKQFSKNLSSGKNDLFQMLRQVQQLKPVAKAHLIRRGWYPWGD
jgi:hypothetical protein